MAKRELSQAMAWLRQADALANKVHVQFTTAPTEAERAWFLSKLVSTINDFQEIEPK